MYDRINKDTDIVGKRFGDLVVTGFSGYVKSRSSKVRMYSCLCDCGRTSIVRRSNLLYGHTTSCGCKSGLPHGIPRHDPIYDVWVKC